jgi:hypothetical protein
MNGFAQIEKWTSPFKIFSLERIREASSFDYARGELNMFDLVH